MACHFLSIHCVKTEIITCKIGEFFTFSIHEWIKNRFFELTNQKVNVIMCDCFSLMIQVIREINHDFISIFVIVFFLNGFWVLKFNSWESVDTCVTKGIYSLIFIFSNLVNGSSILHFYAKDAFILLTILRGHSFFHFSKKLLKCGMFWKICDSQKLYLSIMILVKRFTVFNVDLHSKIIIFSIKENIKLQEIIFIINSVLWVPIVGHFFQIFKFLVIRKMEFQEKGLINYFEYETF